MYRIEYLLYFSLFFIALTVYADDANAKLKKCCKAYEPLQTNKTAVKECLNKFCDFDSLSQTNVSSIKSMFDTFQILDVQPTDRHHNLTVNIF